MCARYTLHAKLQRLMDKFAFENKIEITPSWNNAPSAEAPIIIKNRIGFAQWGLQPPWAADKPDLKAPHNARIETASEKPFFRAAWQKRHCLVPANGFYEWQNTKTGKQPVYFNYNDEPFAFAGLWQKTGEHTVTFTILTQEASGPVKAVHNRMPVILPESAYSDWLDGRADCAAVSQAFMCDIEARHVSKAVNNARNNGPELIENSK